MIELGDKTEVLAIWYVPLGTAGDFLACIQREPEDPAGRWKLRYRFRWYAERRKAFDSDDVKNWWVGHSDDPPDTIIAKLDFIAGLSAKKYGTEVDRIIVRGNTGKAMELLASRPWSHIRREPIS